jgi:short-subunit dehydrogenase
MTMGARTVDEGRPVLITGASSGIGAVFAERLAADGYDLILVARRRERLEELARSLSDRHGVAAEVLTADLSRPGEVERVERRIDALPALEMLINNAGFGTRHRFVELDLSMQLDMIQVHVIASVRLARAALPKMIERGKGAIINVSSLAAFMPMPKTVTYAATKAYLVAFSEGLSRELAGTGVRVQALCPGFTYTEFHDRPEFDEFDRSEIAKGLWMPAEVVVSESLRALGGNRVVCIPGRRNRVLLALARSPIGKVVTRTLARKRWE